MVGFYVVSGSFIFIPNGTIAQLGERAIEVRKVAGSIPARPISFWTFFLLANLPTTYYMEIILGVDHSGTKRL
ncbi:uncharacterized protein N7518_009568 [Penicillium psychrosexuale]|uniref:uncharacterized protein n=1 Tax=Penicillium psychrosexuale TaxID=1002107 RepID=UPI002545791E|nr:uncharacterized protein N7518_009568 [Penicillium psychrosexuale]KAJ5783891.1 hypothetical protein N7518_009568 [Penicillium psychrosexuale]